MIKHDACRALNHNAINKLEYTGARMLDSINHMTLKLLSNLFIFFKYCQLNLVSISKVYLHFNCMKV